MLSQPVLLLDVPPARASSIISLVRSHSFLGLYRLGLMGRKSLIGWPKITWARLIPVSLSGVLQWVRRVLLKLSVSRLPEHPLGALDPEFSTLVGVLEVGGGEAVSQAPVFQEPCGG